MAIGIITGIIIIILAIVSGFIASTCYDNDNNVAGTVATIVTIALVIAFILIPFSFHTVKTGQAAVVEHLGEAKEVKTAGTYFDFWITNKYRKYDTKVQNVDMTTAAYSSDAQTMDIQLTLQYQVLGDNVMDIAKQYGNLKTLENRIQSIAIEKTKSVLSTHKAMDIIANRAQMSPAVEKSIKEVVGEEYFVNLVAVVITNIDFSDSFEAAVEEKMIAEQSKLKAEYENQTKVAQAEAEAEAKIKSAQAEIEIAKAKAEAVKIAAEGEAEANKIISESLNENILNKIIADAWNGEMPAVVGNGEYILPTDIFN
jgi:regulator of protease activity HflC (stomatin/prohibitin superfamily)